MTTVVIALGAGLVAGLLVHGACRRVASREGDMPKPEKPPKPPSFRREVLHRLGVMQQSIDRAQLMVGALTQQVSTMLTKEEFMATFQEVSDKLDTANTALDGLGTGMTELSGQSNEIAQTLRDLVAAGGATPAQLDELVAKSDAMSAKISTVAQTVVDTIASTKDVDPTP
jgi:methyl-accepting chemotaxis protein